MGHPCRPWQSPERGRVTRLQNQTREVQGLIRYAKGNFPAPEMELRMHNAEAHRRLLRQGWNRRLQVQEAMGKEPSTVKLLPGIDEIGYKVIGNEMAICARGLIEITMPDGFRKRYYVS